MGPHPRLITLAVWAASDIQYRDGKFYRNSIYTRPCEHTEYGNVDSLPVLSLIRIVPMVDYTSAPGTETLLISRWRIEL